MDPKELRDKAARLLNEAGQILRTSEVETRELSEDEGIRWDNLHAEAMRLNKLAEKVDAQDEAEKRQLQRNELRQADRRQLQNRELDTPELRAERYSGAFDNWVRRGVAGLNNEQRALIDGGYRALDQGQLNMLSAEQRILGTGDGTAVSTYGGRLVPEGFQAELISAMAQYNGILRNANSPGFVRTLATATGNPLPWPVVDDSANIGALLAEESAAGEEDVVMGQKQLDAYTYTSKMVKVQVQLLQDSAIDINAMLQDLLAKRLGRITAEHFTTGTGTAQPHGLAVAAPQSAVVFSVAGNGLAEYEKLIDLQHEVDSDYRESSAWMFNDASLAQLRKIKDSNGNYIWNSGTQNNVAAGPQPPTLLNKPYAINAKLDGPGTATNVPIIYGDLGYFVVRLVQDMTLLRLEERYAEYLQVGFLMFMRADSELVIAESSGGPVIAGVMAA